MLLKPGRNLAKWNGSCEQSEDLGCLQWLNWLELALSYVHPVQSREKYFCQQDLNVSPNQRLSVTLTFVEFDWKFRPV